MTTITIWGFTFYESPFWAIVGIVVGGIITIITTIIIEAARQPDLHLSIIRAEDQQYEKGKAPAERARFLRVKLANKQLPLISRWWLQRSTAENCHGTITFYDEKLNKIGPEFNDMQIRWTNSPEPMPDILVIEKYPRNRETTLNFIHKIDSLNKVGTITNLARYLYPQSMDVSAGENKAIDIAAKYDDQVECYGWSNETYMYGWKNYRRKINEGDYFVRVIVTSGGKKIKGWFKLKNDLPQTRFHLYYLSHEERNRIKEFKDEPEIWIDI